MEAAGIPKLAQDTLQALRDVLIGWMTIREQSGLRGPITKASDLFFWAGGMRQSLQLIADGKGTEETFDLLKTQLNQTEPDVSAILKVINDGWSDLIKLPDGLDVANELGNVIYSRVGKMGIRYDIGELLKEPPRSTTAVAYAKQICANVDNFNDHLIKLHSRVLKPAAETFQSRNK